MLHERLLGGIIDDSSAIRVVSIIIVVALWLATTAVLNRVLAPTQQPSRALRRAIVDQSVIALLLGLGLWLAPEQTLSPMDAHADFYADVDFYLWLEKQENVPGS